MSAEIGSRAAEYFAAMPDLDWSDLARVHATTAPLLAEIAADRELMREMVLGAYHHPSLWPKCEEGVVEDKIVLWDEPERGFRLRLRMATADQEEMPHQHRFVFSNYVLRGHFLHRNYRVGGSFGEHTRPEDVSTVIVHEDIAGHCFTISPKAVHSTPLPEPGTINLVLRGPAVRERAPVIFAASRGGGDAGGADAPTLEEPETAERGHVFFRVGEEEESAERRAERQMSEESYAAWLGRFKEYGLI